MGDENYDESQFELYDPDSEDIMLKYYLVTPYEDKNINNIGLINYKSEFGKIINKENFIKILKFKKTQKLIDIKKEVSKLSNFPIDVISNYAYISKKEKETNIIDKYIEQDEKFNDITDTIEIKDSRYNDPAEDNRIVYLYIDILKSQKFKLLNDNSNIVEVKEDIIQLQEDYKSLCKNVNSNKDKIDDMNLEIENINELEKKVEENKSQIENNYNDLNYKYTTLKTINEENVKKINNLENENLNLKNKIQEQQNKIDIINEEITNLKLITEKNEKFKNDLIIKEKKSKIELNKIKNDIFTKVLNNKKKEISLVKENFFHEIMTKEISNKSYIINALNKYMKNLSNILFDKSNKFISMYEESISTFLKEEKEENEAKLNLILIGEENAGKSTLINEMLELNSNNRAKEGKNTTGTIEVKKYSNSSKKIEMIDTPGANCTNVGLEDLLLNVNKLINKEENKNIVILYCKKYEYSEYIRFRETEVNLIEKIMNIYHKQNNDLPIIITILQTLEIDNKEELGKIEELILTTLKNNLKDKNNLKNIRIKFVVARRLNIIGNTAEKSGMKELLKTAFDMKIETIISERLAKYNHKMNMFWENFVIEKFEKIDEIINDEIQIIKKALIEGANYFNFYTNDNITNNANKKNKIINIIDDDFSEYIKNKIIEIYCALNDIYDKKKINEDIQIYIEDESNKLYEFIFDIYNQKYELISNNILNEFLVELQKELIKINQKNETMIQIENIGEIENNFKEKYRDIIYKEFFESFICIIFKLFNENLKEIIEQKYNENLQQNEKSIIKLKEKFIQEISNLKQELIEPFETETEK